MMATLPSLPALLEPLNTALTPAVRRLLDRQAAELLREGSIR